MAMVDEIADDLAANAFGTVGTTIFTHSRPPSPDSCLSLHQFALGGPVLTMDGTTKCEQVGLQIQCRAEDDPAAEAACYDVFQHLNGRANVTIGGTWYQGITGRKSPEKLRVDDDGRPIFYCEFTVLKALS